MHNQIESIDIHRMADKLGRELRRIPSDPAFLPEQRRVLLRFISDAQAGRLPGKRSARRLSSGRCLKYITTMRRFALHVRTPFEDVSVAQMEEFIFGIEKGHIQKLNSIGGTVVYSPETVLDFKKMLRRLYRWLLGDCVRYQDLTSWFDTRDQPPVLEVFGLEAAQRMARRLGVPQGQALVMTLFDGGPRAGEFFNFRLMDLRLVPDTDGVPTFLARIRVSKTKARTISLPLATEALRFWVERHPEGGPIQTDGTIAAKNPNAPLFLWTYGHCRNVLREVGRAELKQRVYFHRFRHASATFYAPFLTEAELCARYGWVIGSDAPRRYVDTAAVLKKDTASVIRRSLVSAELSRVPALPTVSSRARAPPAQLQEVEPYEHKEQVFQQLQAADHRRP